MLKCSSARFYSTKQNMKSSKNHYDTLNIKPHATQNEVKSAYYKLTLQYHPDKNESEHAKQKFHDISEAYEVLSNHELRKNYDRHVMLHQQPMSASKKPKSQYKDKETYSGTTKIYNFDAWVQAHYGRELHAQHLRKNAYKQSVEIKEQIKKNKETTSGYAEFSIFLLSIIILAFLFQEKADVPAPTDHEAKNKNNSD